MVTTKSTWGLIGFLLVLPALVFGQPETPVEQWEGKTILLIGAHPDDDSYSYGTLSLLQENGNDIYVMILTTGNVGTKDPDMTRYELAEIRRQEELNALSEVGIPPDHYINLGYVDGLLEFADKKQVVKEIVYYIRKLKPDVLMAFDPGYRYQRWHKTDHRSAAYLAADASRVAEWRLLFSGQIIHQGLEAHRISEYLFYDSAQKDINTWVDITGHVENKINASSQHVSQFTSAWKDYSKTITEEEMQKLQERMKDRIRYRDGTPMEGFRYYSGAPDGIGQAD